MLGYSAHPYEAPVRGYPLVPLGSDAEVLDNEVIVGIYFS